METTLSAIQSVYETMVMGKPADMSAYYSQYTKKELLRFRKMVEARVSALQFDMLALNQQLKDINTEINNRKGGKR